MKTKRLLHWFRMIAIAEGVSFLTLLLLAMPLKYFANLPEPVTVIGWIHGVLFVAFMSMSLEVKSALKKKFSWLVKAFLAAILPFGTFVFDKQLKKEEFALKRA